MELSLQMPANNRDAEAHAFGDLAHLSPTVPDERLAACKGRDEGTGPGEARLAVVLLRVVGGGDVGRRVSRVGQFFDFQIVPSLASFLFELDRGLVRNHWKDRLFRKLYRRAKVAIGM
jgi:hypothetical protein